MTFASVTGSSALVASSRIRIGGSFSKRARDGEPLALAAGEQPAALADAGLEAVGIAVDEVERLRARRGRRAISSSVASGLPTRRFSAIERLNSSVSWNTTPILRRSPVSVKSRMSMPSTAIDARLRIEGAMQQRQRRRFAAAGRADQRHACRRAAR